MRENFGRTGRDFVTQHFSVEKMIEEDLAQCERFTKEKWRKRGLLARFGETFFWLFSENY